jgi:hypothetical protein
VIILTVGALPQNTQWFTTRQTEGTNGHFDVFLNKGRGAPCLFVEAEGYLPQASDAINTSETNLTFALKKGTGPAGVVLKPDGQPAPGVKVYLADMQNGVYVQDNDDWSKTDLPSRYGVDGIPSIFLIGPDGKIIAKDLRGENTRVAVEKALTKTESAKAQ